MSRNVISLLEERATSSASRTAIISYSSATGTLEEMTYACLWTNVCAFKELLEQHVSLSPRKTEQEPSDCQQDDCPLCSGAPRVAVLVDEGVLSIVAVASVWSLGCSVVMVNGSDPRARAMLLNSDVTALIVNRHDSQRELTQLGICSIDASGFDLKTDGERDDKSTMQRDQPHREVEGSVSHLIFTSGSTGCPKACVGTHAALELYARARVKRHCITSSSICYLASAHTFDPFLGDIVCCWLAGASLVTCPRTDTLLKLGQCLQRTRTTHLCATPSLFSTLTGVTDPSSLCHLQYVSLGGEPTSKKLITQWKDHVQLVNMYGVTECCVYQTMSSMNGGENRLLGTPLSEHTRIIIDPIEGIGCKGYETGEVLIAGDQLCLGYWRSHGLTNEKFVEHPIHGRVYKTGDIVRRKDAESSSERPWRIIGRADWQVKLRGNRIELQEIEQVLLAQTCHLLSNVVVVVDKAVLVCVAEVQSELSSSLIDIVTRLDISLKDLDSETAVDYHCERDTTEQQEAKSEKVELLRKALLLLCEQLLPQHMRPNQFHFVASIPSSFNGKTDRKWCQKLVQSECCTVINSLSLEDCSSVDQDLDGIALAIRDIWIEELGVASVHQRTNFITLGGQSLTALRITRKVQDLIDKSSGQEGEDIGKFGENVRAVSPAELMAYPVFQDYMLHIRKHFNNGPGSPMDPPAANAVAYHSNIDSIRDDHRLHDSFFQACSVGATAVVKFLSQSAALSGSLQSSSFYSSQRQLTPLHIACSHGRLDTAWFLLESGALLSTRDQSGCSALHRATQSGSAPLVAVLLESKMDPFDRDDQQQTPLHHAARVGVSSKVFQILLEAMSSGKGRKKGSKGSENNINIRDGWQRTPLHWATVNGHRNVVAWLLKEGCDKCLKDGDGETPLAIAERRARCGAQQRQNGMRASVFGDIAKLLGGSGTTQNVSKYLKQ